MDRVEWIDFIPLGTLTQGGREYLVCLQRNEGAALIMVKRRVSFRNDSLSRQVLSLRHQHILLPRYLFDDYVGQHVGFQYVRFTLGEMLNTHVPVEEVTLHAIAVPIFSALQYLKDIRLVHGHVNTASIRVCGRTGCVYLGMSAAALVCDCDDCVLADGPQHTDLEGLGMTLLDCMEPVPRQTRTVEQIRQQRATNKVFGLRNAERWSGCKSLMDFLDDLFSLQRRPAAKFDRPHEYLMSIKRDQKGVPLHYLELASLECFTMWQAAQA